MIFEATENPQRPVAALTGNGQLCTTIGRCGIHDSQSDTPSMLAAQELVMAGRRLSGPHYKLISFGKLHCPAPNNEWSQNIDTDTATVLTSFSSNGLHVEMATQILHQQNVLVVESQFRNDTDETRSLEWPVDYIFEDQNGFERRCVVGDDRVTIDWSSDDNLGQMSVYCRGANLSETEKGFQATAIASLEPGQSHLFGLIVTMSDRLEFCEPVTFDNLDTAREISAAAWRVYYDQSVIETGNELVDRFRRMSLYTIECQGTPWSVPPSLSNPYWGAGAFHDEYYPFQALLSGGWIERARKIPAFRLTTLASAIERARGQGALYPWSSTEAGQERDPHGHWYSERFHLGQIGASVWQLFLSTGDKAELGRLYPILRETARYFADSMLEQDAHGNFRTKACTDFDESVGAVCGGPFTMCAAINLLESCVAATLVLGLDDGELVEYTNIAHSLRDNLAIAGEHYIVPGAVSQHCSILAPIAPFRLDQHSETAGRTVRHVAESLATTEGWKPGDNDAFDGTTWMWTAGHLGMSAAAVGEADLCWDAVTRGPLSSGQFLSPNEHLSNLGDPVVPWFTTGCGAWLAALQWMFTQIDDAGNHLLPAVPPALSAFNFTGLLNPWVLVKGIVSDGKLTSLTANAKRVTRFAFDVPRRFLEEEVGASPRAQIECELQPGDNIIK